MKFKHFKRRKRNEKEILGVSVSVSVCDYYCFKRAVLVALNTCISFFVFVISSLRI